MSCGIINRPEVLYRYAKVALDSFGIQRKKKKHWKMSKPPWTCNSIPQFNSPHYAKVMLLILWGWFCDVFWLLITNPLWYPMPSIKCKLWSGLVCWLVITVADTLRPWMRGALKKSFPSEPLITLQYETSLYLFKDTSWAYELNSSTLPFLSSCAHPYPSSMALTC